MSGVAAEPGVDNHLLPVDVLQQQPLFLGQRVAQGHKHHQLNILPQHLKDQAVALGNIPAFGDCIGEHSENTQTAKLGVSVPVLSISTDGAFTETTAEPVNFLNGPYIVEKRNIRSLEGIRGCVTVKQ